MCDGKVDLLGGRDVDHYPLQDDDGICRHTTRLIYSEKNFKAKGGEISPTYTRMLAYVCIPPSYIRQHD